MRATQGVRRGLVLLAVIAAATTAGADTGVNNVPCTCPRPDESSCFNSSECGPGGVCYPYPEWPVCEPAGCICEDGFWRCAAICAGRCFPGTPDSDCDGRSDWRDCSPSNPSVWATPGEVFLRFSSVASLQWSAPSSAGGMVTTYDTLRSVAPGDFLGPAVCVESDDGSDRVAVDTMTPDAGQIWFYLVRARNACPGASGLGPLGRRSDGTVTEGRDCP